MPASRSLDAVRRESALWHHAVAAHHRLNFLSEAGRVLSDTLDIQIVLGRLAQLAVPQAADWCVIDLAREDGSLELVGAAAHDPRKAELLRVLRRRYPPRDERHPVIRALREARPVLQAAGDDAWVGQVARSAGHRRLLERLAPGSFVCAPLTARGRSIGVLTFGRHGREMTAADVELGRDLGLRAGAAIENARLYEKARRAEASLSQALAANRMAAWSSDLEGGNVERSANAAEIYGAEPGVSVGAAARPIHPEDRASYERAFRRAVSSRGPFQARFRVIRRDGTVVWLEEHARVTPGADGAAPRVTGIVLDATEHKAAEDELRAQAAVSRVLNEAVGEREAFPRLLEAIGRAFGWPLGFAWRFDPPTRRLTLESSWGRLGDRTPWLSGLASRGPQSCVDGPLGQAVVRRRLAKVCRSAGGRRMCAMAFPILAHGRVLGVLEFVGEDVETPPARREDLLAILGRQIGLFLERRRAGTVLERQRLEQELILDSVPAMIWFKDDANRVLRVNRAAAEWYGKPRSEIEGRLADELFPKRAGEYRKDDLAVIASGRPRLGLIEQTVSPRGRRCWLRRDLVPWSDPDDGAHGVVVFAVDITEIKRAEQVLRESEQAQRDFVANVSHEFRTPVSAIKGFAETLRRGGLEDTQNRLGFVRTIESHADRLDWLVQDLLDLARLGSGMVQLKSEPIPVREFFESQLAATACVIRRRRARVEVDADARLRARGDRAHLTQVLDNLLGNALKYSPQGSLIRLEGRADKDRVRLTVRDHGMGIAAEHLPRLFDRFYRVAKGDGGGSTGLGLHIVKTIVEASKGRVWVESRPGRGSAFHVSLPRA